MAFTFFYASGSPFSWRVHLALEHKQAEFTARLISFDKNEHKTPEFLAISPRHQVPVITDDGFALYESGAIVEYIEERFLDGPPLFPGDRRARAIVRQWVHETQSTVAVEGEVLVREIFYESDPEKRNRRAIFDATSALAGELERIETRLTGEWLVGPLSAADFALYPLLALYPRFERRQPELGLTRLIGPNLRAWMGRIEALPYFETTYPPHWRT
jgi:glutathione S-transferase